VSDLATFEVFESGEPIRAGLVGEVDSSNTRDLQIAIMGAMPRHTAGMVLDLSGLTYVDSAGIRMLLTLVGRFRWRGQELLLVAPEGSRARTVLALAGAEDALVSDGDQGRT
jgi:anti-anti-sigma factor